MGLVDGSGVGTSEDGSVSTGAVGSVVGRGAAGLVVAPSSFSDSHGVPVRTTAHGAYPMQLLLTPRSASHGAAGPHALTHADDAHVHTASRSAGAGGTIVGIVAGFCDVNVVGFSVGETVGALLGEGLCDGLDVGGAAMGTFVGDEELGGCAAGLSVGCRVVGATMGDGVGASHTSILGG